MRWRATSFSSTSTELPLLLGAENGTLPLGSEVKNKLSLEDGSIFLVSLLEPIWSFLPSRHEQMETKRIKNRTSCIVPIRPIERNWW